MPDRLSQNEEERFQQGRRDAHNNIEITEEQKTDPFYAEGWREGKLEQLEQMIQKKIRRRRENDLT